MYDTKETFQDTNETILTVALTPWQPNAAFRDTNEASHDTNLASRETNGASRETNGASYDRNLACLKAIGVSLDPTGAR